MSRQRGRRGLIEDFAEPAILPGHEDLAERIGLDDAVHGQGVEVLVGHDQDRNAMARFDLGHGLAFFVQHEIGDRHRRLDHDLAGVFLHAFLFDEAKDGKGQRFDTADRAVTVTARVPNAATSLTTCSISITVPP